MKCLFLYTNISELKELYKEKSEQHNDKILNTKYPDSGFDLYNPEVQPLVGNQLNKVDFKVNCALFDPDKNVYLSYYLYPRSSMSRTPLRLANSVGIIDSGYRGNIKGAFDVKENYLLEHKVRIVQLCTGTLEPFLVKVLDTIEELGDTERGTGGFGSTGV